MSQAGELSLSPITNSEVIMTEKPIIFNDGDLILVEPEDQQYLREHCKIEEPKIPKFMGDLING